MKEDRPMRILISSKKGYVSAIGVSTDEALLKDPVKVERLFDEWNSKLQLQLGPTRFEKSWLPEKWLYWRDPDENSALFQANTEHRQMGNERWVVADLTVYSES